MAIKNIYKRIVTFLTWPVLIFFMVYKWTYKDNLIFTIFMFLACIVASYEMQNILFPKEKRKAEDKTKREAPLIPFWLPSVLVVASYLENVTLEGVPLVQLVLISLIVLAFFVEVIKGANEDEPFSKSITNIAKTVLLIVYPSYICTFPIMLINLCVQGPIYILMLFLLVFGNDTFCYIFGMLLGKTSRGVFKVSPKKSVVGYLAGLILTPLLSYYFARLMPGMPQISRISSAILGVLIAITADIGDLVESAFKRSANVKDSGCIIWGRGGVLDSFDSFFNSAPIFCLWIQWSLGYLGI